MHLVYNMESRAALLGEAAEYLCSLLSSYVTSVVAS
jgi:hypothetical protein